MTFNLLAIETATEACSAGLITQGQCTYTHELALRAHSQLILPMIESLLKAQKLALGALTHLAVGQGPGSFTGVRIGVGVAQGLAFGLSLPVYPISTLGALAYSAQQFLPKESKNAPIYVLPLLDARMQEVYGGIYLLKGEDLRCLEENLYTPQEYFQKVLNLSGKIIALGSGWDEYASVFNQLAPAKLKLVEKQHYSFAIGSEQFLFFKNCYPHARDVALLAKQQWMHGYQGVNALEIQPIYLRDKVVSNG